MIDTVIFDMDGVLIDSEPVYFHVERELFRYLGLDISNEKHETFVGMAMPDIWEIIKSEYDIDYTIEELVGFHKKAIHDYFIKAENLVTIPGITVLLKYLKNKDYKLGVASSTDINLVKVILLKLEIIDYFDELAGGNEVKKGKPSPDVFLLVAKKLKSSPRNCLVWEDSKNGVESARRAEMEVIGFQNKGSGNQDLSLADWVVDSFENLDYKKLDYLLS
jgi:HAD superfamily hydrolase (TIGR01509 family)